MSYPVKLPVDEPLVTITHPSPYQWVLELHHGTDNRLRERMLREAIRPALDLIEKDWRESTTAAKKANPKDEKAGAGSLVIVGKRGQEKFFSNGFQFEDVLETPHFIHSYYNPVITRLLTYPIPVICAMNGHTFAAGFNLAMACDYRVMKTSKAWASMNEIQFGATAPRSFAAVFTAKAANANIVRKIWLEGHRWTAQELEKEGLVDQLVEGDTEKVLEAAQALGNKLALFARTGVYGLQKEELYRQAILAAQERPMQFSSVEAAELFVDTHRARL